MRTPITVWASRLLLSSHARGMAVVPAVLLALTGSVVLTASSRTVQAGAAPAAPHVMVIIMENTAYDNSHGSPYIVGNSSAPYINNTLVPQYTSATQWYSVEHVSDYDYYDLVSGADQKGKTKPVTATSFPDQLAANGISWKAYMEGMPSSCYAGGATGNYVSGHNPFVHFTSIVNNPAQCKNVVPYTQSQMTSDLNQASPPSFVWISPNQCDDMHTKCAPTSNLVKQGDNWLQTTIPAVQSTQWYTAGGIIIVTWDESVVPDTSGAPSTSDSGGHVATLVISAGNHSPYTAAGDHFGTLHGLQNAYGVGCLAASCNSGHGDISAAFPSSSPGSIKGTVSDSSTTAPIQNAIVTCSVCSPTSTTTDSKGLYTLTAPVGSDSVTFSDSGYVSQTDLVAVTSGTATAQNAALAKDGSITGTVTDSSTKNVIPNATVACSVCSPVSTTTASDGTYTLANAPPGSDSVTFSATGYASVTDTVTVPSGAATTQNQALTRQTNGSITGTVTDSSTNKGIPNATVACPVCSPTSTPTASDGTYTLASAPPGGDSVTFSATEYTSVTDTVTVSSGTAATQNQALSPASQVIFSDGFEPGFSAWTSATGLTTEKTTVHSGSYAAQGAVSSAAADARKTLPSTYASGYERVWFNLSSASTQVYVLQANTTANVSVAIVYVNSKGLLGLQAADGSRHDSTTTVTANTWQEVELSFSVNGSSSAANLWLDGVDVLSLTGINLKTTAVGVMQVGDATPHTWTAFFDDAAFDTHFIP